MRDLPASIFATAGVRAHGSRGVLPEDDEYAGLDDAEWVSTPWGEPLRPLMFTFVTTCNRAVGGGKPVRRPFFVTQLPYDRNYPDRVGVRGYWLIEGTEALVYHDVKRMRRDVKACLLEMNVGSYILDKTWRELVSITQVELGIAVALGSSETDDTDCDTIPLIGVFAIEQWKHVIHTLTASSTIADIVSLLELSPPSGSLHFTNIVPLQPSFEPVPDDVFSIEKRVFLIGAAAGQPSHAIEFTDSRDGSRCRMRPEGRPSGGVLIGTRLLLAAEARASISIPVEGPYLIHGESELVLTEELVSVPISCMQRCIPILAVPPRANVIFGMAYEAATRPMELVLADGSLAVIAEPRTEEQVRADLLSVATSVGFEGIEDTRRLLLNEVRLQATPEKQTNLADSRVVLRGFSLARALMIMRDPVWRGDRSLTLEQYLTRGELCNILGELPSDGWIIPEKEPDARGVVRKRTKNKGYLLVMTHDDGNGRGSNVLAYCLETKCLTLRLALGYFGENLKFVKGATPPARAEGETACHEFDIVTRTYQLRTDGVVWTEARALAHFDQHFERLS